MRYERKIVKNYTDADRLMKLGFQCLGVNINTKESGKLIFWFENSEAVNQALREISEEIKRENKEKYLYKNECTL